MDSVSNKWHLRIHWKRFTSADSTPPLWFHGGIISELVSLLATYKK